MNGKGMFVVVVLCLAVAGGLYFWTSKDGGVLGENAPEGVSPVPVNPIDLPQTQGEGITVEHSYVDGVHTYTGEINLPTPCHELSNSVEIKHTQPEQVSINFIATTRSEMCTQVVSREPFSVVLSASADAVVHMTLNGKELPFFIAKDDVSKVPSIAATSSQATTSSTSSLNTKFNVGATTSANDAAPVDNGVGQ